MAENLTPTTARDSETAEPLDAQRPAAGPQAGIGLCLSGGGYRAMLFHLGALWRLNELGLLPGMQRISSVSGGSIVSAYLGLRWQDLGFQTNPVSDQFIDVIVTPIRKLASITIDVGSVFGGLLNPFSSISDHIREAYADNLFGAKTLQDLPDAPAPRFVINATSVQTGALWRFSKPYMGDYHVGLAMNPQVSLALAVTASSAFPPFLSPVHMKLSGVDFTAVPGADLTMPPYTTDVVLSDGGVYDNLGLETVFKRYDTILCSDGGAAIAPEPSPDNDWARHSYRILNIIDNQVRSLRKRILISAYQDRTGDPRTSRKGAYWGIGTDISNYQLPSALPCPHDRTLELANVATRLASLDDATQERLINWGYAVCDAAIRKHVDPTATSQPQFPYDGGV